MRQALDSWVNATGETVVLHAGGLAVLARGVTVAQWQQSRRPTPRATLRPTTPQQAVERLTAAVTRLRAVVPRRSLAAEVTAALRDHPDVIASVDESAGVVRAVVLPRHPAVRHADDVERLQRRATELRALIDHPQTTFVVRTRAGAELRDVEQRLEIHRRNLQPWTRPDAGR
jgi:hypothetical protein